MSKMMTLGLLAGAANGESLNLGFDSKLDADKAALVFRTIEISAADVALAGAGAKLFLVGSRSLTPEYNVYIKKGGNPAETDTEILTIAKGSATGYAETTIDYPVEAGSYTIGMKSTCAVTCTGQSTTISAYLKTSDGALAPFRITKDLNMMTAYYRGQAKDQVGAPYAVLSLDTADTVYFSGDTKLGGKMKIVYKKAAGGGGGNSTSTGGMDPPAGSDKKIPTASGINKDWSDQADLEAGTYHISGIVDEQTTSSVAVEYTFAVGIGAPPVSAAYGLAPAFGFVASMVALAGMQF